MCTKKRLVVALLAGLTALYGPLAMADAGYGQIGTEGAAIGYGHALGLLANVRAEFNGFSFSHSFNLAGLHYDGTATLAHAGLYGDFFPAPTVVPFRFTAGLLIGSDNVDADATRMSGTYTINGVKYSMLGESIHAKAKFPVGRPYLGIGFGHSPLATKGFSMFVDAGVAYGKPRADFDVPADIVAEAGQADVDAEKQSRQNTADRLRFTRS